MTEKPNSETTRRTVCRALGAAVGGGTITGAASAADGSSTSTASPTETPAGESVVVEIDKVTRITDWRFDAGTFFITFDCETPQILKITDSGAVMKAWADGGDGGGATSIPTQGFTLSSGKTTIEFDATVFEEAAAISVATSDGTAFVFSEGIEIGKPPVEQRTVQGMLAAAVGGTGMLTYRWTRDKQDDEEHEHERVV